MGETKLQSGRNVNDLVIVQPLADNLPVYDAFAMRCQNETITYKIPLCDLGHELGQDSFLLRNHCTLTN